MARVEFGTSSYDYDGPRCPWCGGSCEYEPCPCAMATAARADAYNGPDDEDGEVFRGRDADGYRSEQMAAWQRLK